MKKIQIIIPKIASTNIELKLVELSRQIRLKNNSDGSFGLGGVDGYGEDYENEVFMMHRYCWCEKDNCKWCNGDAPNFLYKPTNTKIWWYKWIGRDQRQKGNLPKDWLEKCIDSIWKNDKYKSWYEFEEDENKNIFVTLCFNVYDKNSIVKAELSPFATNNYQYWDLDAILHDIANAQLKETKEYKKAIKLNKKYPMLKEKIKAKAIENCKNEINRLKRLIKEYGNNKK